MSVSFVSHEFAYNVIRFSRMPNERSPALAPGPCVFDAVSDARGRERSGRLVCHSQACASRLFAFGA